MMETVFKGRHFAPDLILLCVHWSCRYGVSYRDLEQMMAERGTRVDHCTIYRRVQRYAPEMEKRLRWQWRCPRSTNWRRGVSNPGGTGVVSWPSLVQRT